MAETMALAAQCPGGDMERATSWAAPATHDAPTSLTYGREIVAHKLRHIDLIMVLGASPWGFGGILTHSSIILGFFPAPLFRRHAHSRLQGGRR